MQTYRHSVSHSFFHTFILSYLHAVIELKAHLYTHTSLHRVATWIYTGSIGLDSCSTKVCRGPKLKPWTSQLSAKSREYMGVSAS